MPALPQINSTVRIGALAVVLTIAEMGAMNRQTHASPPEVLDAAAADFRAMEARLTQVSAAVSRKLKHPIMRRDFAAAQKAWVQYREKEASWRAGFTSEGASAYNSDYLRFKTELTEQRIREISKLVVGNGR